MSSLYGNVSLHPANINNNSVELGAPIPTDQHAVSVSLPTWQDVVGYEEGDLNILSKLTVGYPRFRIHDNVELLNKTMLEKLKDNQLDENNAVSVMCFPTLDVVLRFIQYIQVV